MAFSYAHASQTVTLPSWVCAQPDAIFVSAFDATEVPVPHNPTNGTGGASGTTTHIFHISGLGTGTQTYYLYVPSTYTSSRAYPFVMALHGTAPYASRTTYASNVLSAWQSVADVGEIIVAAPVADEKYDAGSGVYGATWAEPPMSPSDYDLFAAVLSDVEQHFNIEQTRLYGWGFSAGGSVMHVLGLTDENSAINNATLSAYASDAGPLAEDLCYDLSNTDCAAKLATTPRKIPIAMNVGTADPAYGYVESDDSQFVASGWTSNQNVFLNINSENHDYSSTDVAVAWGHLCSYAVTP